MLSGSVIVGASFAYLLLLFAVAYFGDRRADQGCSVIANPWVYSLSLAVYCTAWTYFGSVGRAASGGIWFLPIYLGPTLGLALSWLVDAGNSVLIIEHNLDIIKTADYIIDLGPEGGDRGGELVAAGTPEEICLVKKSFTGQVLKEFFEDHDLKKR